jgi:hypothetical protein
MKLQSIAPERLVAVRIIAENILTILNGRGSVGDYRVAAHDRNRRKYSWWLSVNETGERACQNGASELD